MNVARTAVKGLACCDTRRAFRGFTLYTPTEGREARIVDMSGRCLRRWRLPFEPCAPAELLPDGHLLYMGRDPDGPLADIEGAGGVAQELDAEGAPAWEYRDPFMHHAPFRSGEGSTLVLKWVPVPEAVAARVSGGLAGSERAGVMFGEAVLEIRPDGFVERQWIAHQHLEPGTLKRCPLCPRDTWLHGNSVQQLADGKLLLSFAKVNTIAVVDMETGGLVWHWGCGGELTHQHAPVMLESGNILLFDNGYHPNGLAQNFSRALEIDPGSAKMVWSFEGHDGGDLRMLFYSSMHSNCQRLPNGNTLICEGMTGRLFEVTAHGDLVWEYVHAPDSEKEQPYVSHPVHGCFRYDLDYPGLAAAGIGDAPSAAGRNDGW